MKLNDLIIMDVVLARPTGNRDSAIASNKGQFTRKLLIEFCVEKTATCVIDSATNKAINIETHEVFDIVKRDDEGKVLQSELSNLSCEQVVALKLMEKDWDRISMLYQLELKSRAKKVLVKYKDEIKKQNEDLNVKVKRKDKN